MISNELPERHRISLFALSNGRPLLERVCAHLGVSAGRHEERVFEDGEHKIRPLESVRGQDVYVVQSLYGDDALSVNDKLVRLLFFLGALRTAGAARINVIAPYLCYSRKDVRTKPRDPVTTRYVATIFEAMGTDRIATVDVHNAAAYENAFRIPAELLSAVGSFVELFVPLLGDRSAVVVSPDAGGVKRAERFRQVLERQLDRPVGSAFLEKSRSEGVVRGGAVVGDVSGRVAIIIDDLISSGTTLARAAVACRDRGAVAVFAAATHGVFSADARATLDASPLERIVILDTIPITGGQLGSKLEVIDCSPLLAAAIHRLHTGGSLTELDE